MLPRFIVTILYVGNKELGIESVLNVVRGYQTNQWAILIEIIE